MTVLVMLLAAHDRIDHDGFVGGCTALLGVTREAPDRRHGTRHAARSAMIEIRDDGGPFPFLLDLARRELTSGAAPIHVEPRVFDLIALLVVHTEQVVDNRTISDKLWPNETVCDGALRQCVWSARRALGDSARTSAFILTVHRVGYRFVGRVVLESRTALRLSRSSMRAGTKSGSMAKD